MKYCVGIDLGTSAVKMILMDEAGSIIRTVSKQYPIYYPHPSWSEQNPEDWYNATIEGLSALVKGVESKVQGLGIAGQMHGLVLLDQHDNVIRPCILWNDGRAVEETAYLNHVIGKEQLSAWTGNIAFAGFSAPKLLWVRVHEPDAFRRIAKIMLPKDYLVYKLTGEFTTDPSDASGTLFFDVENRSWSHGLMQICGIDQHMLPRICESYEAVGQVRDDICRSLGLGCVTVAAGAGDNAAAAIGTGTVDEGTCTISLGTSGTIFIPSNVHCPDRNNALHAFAHASGGYHLMGCILSAASCGKWWLEDILGTQDHFAEQAMIHDLGENNVYFLPYMMGERSPHNDPSARGVFLGMTLDTTRAQMTQAIYEGVAFSLRDCLEVAHKSDVNIFHATLCGGGAKSPLWRKIITNVLNLDINIQLVEEGPSAGAAFLAAVASGMYTNIKNASKINTKIMQTCHPDTVLAEKYAAKYEIFKRIYPQMKEVFQLL